jgi:peptidoglycan/LPS O-acetylase OafA/YrhL
LKTSSKRACSFGNFFGIQEPHLLEHQPVTGNTEVTAPENRVFFPALDGLRCIAFLLVVGQHFMQLPWGYSGVNIFFVLSGFLITGILWDTRDHVHRVRNFYIRRTLRIFPLYYGIFALLLITTPYFHWQWSKYWIAWPLYLGNYLRFLGPESANTTTALWSAADAHLRMRHFLLGDMISVGHFWSLGVEEQFYLVWPWIVFSIRSRKALLWICGSVVVLLPFVRLLLQPHIPGWMLKGEFFYRVTPFQLDSLLLGALLALLWRGEVRQHLVDWSLRITPAVLLLCAIGYFWTMAHSPEIFVKFRYPAWQWTFGLSLTNFVAALVMLCSLRPGTWVYRLLSLPLMRWVGRISYGGYIYHAILVGFVFSYFRLKYPAFDTHHRFYTGVICSVPSLLITLGLSWLSFRFYESKFLNLKEKWAR